LTDIVFVTYQKSIHKDICKIKEFEDTPYTPKGALYTHSLFRAILSDHKLIYPQKQTYSANLAISLDSSHLSAVDAIMTVWTKGISNEFKEKCLLDSEICDEKYYEFYGILTEKVIEMMRNESRYNITYKKASPLQQYPL